MSPTNVCNLLPSFPLFRFAIVHLKSTTDVCSLFPLVFDNDAFDNCLIMNLTKHPAAAVVSSMGQSGSIRKLMHSFITYHIVATSDHVAS